jgi:hypothetical protein
MYTIDGGVLTMQSAWNGPPGQMVQALGKCFHPNTKIKLQNGNIVLIKDVNLGDILEDGSVVESTMQIDNKINPISMYKIEGRGVNGEDIFVTGSHLVFDKKSKQFLRVVGYSKSVETPTTPDYFCCLITSTHNIKIGKELFWDWEDHFVKFRRSFL